MIRYDLLKLIVKFCMFFEGFNYKFWGYYDVDFKVLRLIVEIPGWFWGCFSVEFQIIFLNGSSIDFVIYIHS